MFKRQNSTFFEIPIWLTPIYNHPNDQTGLRLYEWPFRQFPPVNSEKFQLACSQSITILNEAQRLLSQLSASKPLATSIKRAAQQSNSTEVARLVKSTGIQMTPQISFTPDAIRFIFQMNINNTTTPCCRVQLNLTW